MATPDKVALMLQRQKEREEAMRKKEEDRQAKENEAKQAQNAAYMAKAPAAAKKQEAPATPTDNWYLMRQNLYAPLPPPTRGKPTLLGGDPSGENILFCIGNSVIIRSLKNPLIADIYSEHAHPTTVARYSPDGKFIASGDQSGMVRVWHTEIIQGTVHKLKLEKKTLGGAILDMQWDVESKRIVAVGQGRDKFGVLFFAENGASAGEITGHSKSVTCVDFRPTKPYRVVTGGEDFVVNWTEGPPFKWKHSLQNFSNFINSARFSPDGKTVIVVAQDKKGIFLDGETGQVKYEFDTAGAHTGGIYGACFSPDSSKVLTVSGDKTAKIWDASNGKCLQTFTFGNTVEDQLLGCLWQGEYKIVQNLAGHLIYLPNTPGEQPPRVIKGHSKSIESIAYDPSSNSIVSGSYDAILTKWNVATGDMVDFSGKGHTNAIKGIAIQGKNVITASLDDTLRITSLDSLSYGTSVSLGNPPIGVAAARNTPGLIVTATNKSVVCVKNNAIAFQKDIANLGPQAIALSVNDQLVAVGAEDNNVYLYSIAGGDFKEEGVLKGHRGIITRLDFSPDGKMLVSADRNREVIVWNVATKDVRQKDWVYHTARIDALAFSPNSKYVASGGLDQTIIIWSLENPTSRVTIKGAHQGGITELLWLNDNTVVSAGQDVTIRTWKVL